MFRGKTILLAAAALGAVAFFAGSPARAGDDWGFSIRVGGGDCYAPVRHYYRDYGPRHYYRDYRPVYREYRYYRAPVRTYRSYRSYSRYESYRPYYPRYRARSYYDRCR